MKKLLLLFGLLFALGAGIVKADEYYLSGDFNGWSTTTHPFRLQSNGNNLEMYLQKLPTGKFKIVRITSTGTYWYGANGEPTIEVPSKNNFNLNYNEGNIVFPSGNPNNVIIYLNLKSSGSDNGVPGDLWINTNDYKTSIPTMPVKVYLQGKINGRDWDTYNATELKSKEAGVYTADEVYVFGSDAYFHFTEYSGSGWDQVGMRFSATSENDEVNTSNTNNVKQDMYQGWSFKLPKGRYSMTLNLNTNKLTVRSLGYPNELYLYGHIKNKYWLGGNSIKLVKNGNKYKNAETDPVEISGYWSQRDIELNGKDRTLYDSTEDENYVALFDWNPTEFPAKDNEGKDLGMKLGSLEKENNDDNYSGKDRNNNVGRDNRLGNPQTLVYQAQADLNNFKVPQGYYNVEVDLENGTVKFERLENKERQYVWYSGNDNNSQFYDTDLITDMHDDGYATYSFDLQKEPKAAMVQVGVGENPEHKLARIVEYTVYKKGTSDPGVGDDMGPSYAKRKADVTKPAAYNATAVEDTDYKTHGDEKYNTNHVIEFMAPGEYFVIASRTDDQSVLAKDNTLTTIYNNPDAVGLAVTVTNGNTPTGVDAIGAENDGEATYYNLQGVKVENPDHGVYVKVVGGKASKVVL